MWQVILRNQIKVSDLCTFKGGVQLQVCLTFNGGVQLEIIIWVFSSIREGQSAQTPDQTKKQTMHLKKGFQPILRRKSEQSCCKSQKVFNDFVQHQMSLAHFLSRAAPVNLVLWWPKLFFPFLHKKIDSTKGNFNFFVVK